MLRTDVDEILRDDKGMGIGVRVGDQAASAKFIIGDASFFPPEKVQQTGSIVRSICLLRQPLPKTNGASAQVCICFCIG
jgi:Rab GDP dissociation inhibitor